MDFHDKFAALAEHMPGPGEPDYTRFQMMPDDARYNYLLARKNAAERAFQQGFSKAPPLAAVQAGSKINSGPQTLDVATASGPAPIPVTRSS